MKDGRWVLVGLVVVAVVAWVVGRRTPLADGPPCLLQFAYETPPGRPAVLMRRGQGQAWVGVELEDLQWKALCSFIKRAEADSLPARSTGTGFFQEANWPDAHVGIDVSYHTDLLLFERIDSDPAQYVTVRVPRCDWPDLNRKLDGINRMVAGR